MKKLLALFSAAMLALTCHGQENLLKNPGFEDVNAKGGAANWNGSAAVFSRDTTVKRSGNASLHFSNKDPKVYVLCVQNVKLKPGTTYKMGVWTKTAGLKGDGPTICAEWWNADGKFLGGNYPSGLKDTNGEWMLADAQFTFRETKAASCHIVMYCRQNSTGDAWFDDAFLYELQPQMLHGGVTHLYRNISDGEDLTMFFSVDARDEQERAAILASASISLKDSKGNALTPPAFKPAPGDIQTIDVPMKPLAPGKYTLAVTVKHPSLKKTETLPVELERVAVYPQFKSYIDVHNRMILDGKPFFPLGLYFCQSEQKYIDDLGDSPMNCIMPYSPLKRETLDKLHAKNVKVFYSVKDCYPGHGGLTNMEQANAKCRKLMEAVKNHPAIAAWYVNDEAPISKLPMLIERRKMVQELDPSRPTWTVLYQFGDVRDYIHSFDVIGTDPYPIPNGLPSRAYQWAKTTTDQVFNCRANWMVPQIFNWAGYWKRYGKPEAEIRACRRPTYQEMKAMSWMCIAGGANGLVAYSYEDLLRMNKSVANGGRALDESCVEPYDKIWPEIKRYCAEIKELTDVLLAVDSPMPLTRLDKGEDVVTRIYGKGDETWLLLVNSHNEKTAGASFQLPASAAIGTVKLADKAKPALADGKLAITLQPLECAFIQLKK